MARVRFAASATLTSVQEHLSARRRATRPLGGETPGRAWIGLGPASEDERRTSAYEQVLVHAARTASLETVSTLDQLSLSEFVR